MFYRIALKWNKQNLEIRTTDQTSVSHEEFLGLVNGSPPCRKSIYFGGVSTKWWNVLKKDSTVGMTGYYGRISYVTINSIALNLAALGAQYSTK